MFHVKLLVINLILILSLSSDKETEFQRGLITCQRQMSIRVNLNLDLTQKHMFFSVLHKE